MQGMQGLQIKTDYAKGRRTKNATLKTEDAEDGEDAEVAQTKLKYCFESQSFETKGCSMAEDARDAGVANKNRLCLGREHQECYFKNRGCGGWRGCRGCPDQTEVLL